MPEKYTRIVTTTFTQTIKLSSLYHLKLIEQPSWCPTFDHHHLPPWKGGCGGPDLPENGCELAGKYTVKAGTHELLKTILNRRELDICTYKVGQQGRFQGLLHSEKGTTHLDSEDHRKRALCFFLGNCCFLRKSDSGESKLSPEDSNTRGRETAAER